MDGRGFRQPASFFLAAAVALGAAGCQRDSPALLALSLPGQPLLSSMANGLDFGETLVVGGAQVPITLTNPDSSSHTLQFQAVVDVEPFSLKDAKGSIRPGESSEILVRFQPPRTGSFSGEITIVHNAGNLKSPLSIPVTGIGTRTFTFSGNPLFWAADPSGHVWSDGSMWIYPTTDSEDWDELVHWNAWSSEDLRTWTVHPEIFSARDCAWCQDRAWAPDVAFRNGRYFLYYYFANKDGGPRGVGVAVGDEPQGPFLNATPDGPLVDGHDPAVFVDDDGQAYLYTGHIIYFLAPDMVSLIQEGSRPKDLPLELRGHQPEGGWEAVWVFKRKDLYYLSLADGDYRQLRYYMASSPLGPFQYAGTLLEPSTGLNIHHSIVAFQDRWILWYHVWPETGPGQRRIQGEILTFNEDGTIQPVSVSEEGVGG